MIPDTAITCLRCNVPLMTGKAIRNTLVGSPDFPGDTGNEAGCTMHEGGPGELVECLKCPKCGHSISVE